jgi:acyl-CoA synthetase (AMP-forming)/AMP-acid ligase II
MINVGGYKVNPNEVEEAILQIEGITDARIFAKKNSVTGNILCCELISRDSRLTESSIRSILAGRLQNYKIPRIFTFTDEISTSRTGKKKRT